MKLLLYTILTICSAVLIFMYGSEIIVDLIPQPLASAPPMPPPAPIGIEAGPVKVLIDESTTWQSIAKLLVTVLGTFLGYKLINKYV